MQFNEFLIISKYYNEVLINFIISNSVFKFNFTVIINN